MVLLPFFILSCKIQVITCFTPTSSKAAPKDYTNLIEDSADNSPLGERIPLILIHGVHGNKWPTGEDNINNPYLYYWQTFRMFFYSWNNSGLKNKFKLYTFWYISDEISVDEISKGLRDWIDEKTYQMDEKPFVIVAHSMGGLVSRAFMNKTFNVGNWSGKAGGDRTLKLITLATPHHGSHGANGTNFGECFNNEADLLWRPSIHIIGVPCWGFLLPTSFPNRNDLLWDNYNGSMSDCNENNGLLPISSTYDNKIIAYGGILPVSDPGRPNDPVNFVELYYSEGIDDHSKLLFASVLLYEAMQNPEEYGENDGMVPISSSFFYGHNIDHHHLLTDFDHAEMKGDDLSPANIKYDQLFDPITDDLNSLVFGINISPANPRAPVTITFSPVGGFSANASYEWQFHDGSISHEQSPNFLYRHDGTYSVTMTVHDPGLGDIVRTKTILVGNPEIDVSCPDGCHDLHRHFSADSNSHIDHYTWNYGDGTPQEDGRTQGHTYADSGYYTVTLYITLDDNSVITSQKGIWVGPGTRYIQGHTIYGDENWDNDEKYVVMGSITIAQGATLTIEHGTRVELNGGVQISVYGTLTATGVTFTWADGQNQWGGNLV
jgi:pimeloyl-ACP methyl ester carboxylesterase